MQDTGAVNAFDADQFDVAGSRGAGDEGVRTGRIEPLERVGQVRGDLTGLDDDQVEVGHQGERAAALTGAMVQDDRAGFGDRDRASRNDPGHLVEFGRRERRFVAGQLDAWGQRGQPSGRESVRHDEGTGCGGGTLAQDAGDGGGESGLGNPLDDGAVVGGALGEQFRGVVRGRIVVGAQVPPGQRRVRRVDVGRRRPSVGDAVGARATVSVGAVARTSVGAPARAAAGVAARILARIWSFELLMAWFPWSGPTRRGTIPVAGPGRRGFPSSRSAAAATA